MQHIVSLPFAYYLYQAFWFAVFLMPYNLFPNAYYRPFPLRMDLSNDDNILPANDLGRQK